ncbi:hypothetical protein pb186bvf_017348 [Paramecium bursaria]
MQQNELSLRIQSGRGCRMLQFQRRNQAISTLIIFIHFIISVVGFKAANQASTIISIIFLGTILSDIQIIFAYIILIAIYSYYLDLFREQKVQFEDQEFNNSEHLIKSILNRHNMSKYFINYAHFIQILMSIVVFIIFLQASLNLINRDQIIEIELQIFCIIIILIDFILNIIKLSYVLRKFKLFHFCMKQNKFYQDGFLQKIIKKDDKELECIICLQQIKKGYYQIILDCHSTHIYHQLCIEKWLLIHEQCPKCKRTI